MTISWDDFVNQSVVDHSLFQSANKVAVARDGFGGRSWSACNDTALDRIVSTTWLQHDDLKG